MHAGIRRSYRQRFEQCITGIEVVVDGDLGGQIIGKIIQLPPTAYRHQDARGTFLNGNFNLCVVR